MKIYGKVAVVVGGTTGIGRACVEALLEKGTKVYFGDNQDELGEEVVKSLQSMYPFSRHLYRRCDVRKLTDIQDLVTNATKEFGQVEIFLNTAGVIDEGNFERCTDVNLNGAIRCVEVALKTMGKNHGGQGGVVVQISSIGGVQPVEWGPVYAATKYGIVGLIRSWATPNNYKAHGIRFNCICPGTVDTPFIYTINKGLPEHGNALLLQNRSLTQEQKISPALVAEGFLKLVEEDDHNGRAMRVTKTHGIDFTPFEEFIFE